MLTVILQRSSHRGLSLGRWPLVSCSGLAICAIPKDRKRSRAGRCYISKVSSSGEAVNAGWCARVARSHALSCAVLLRTSRRTVMCVLLRASQEVAWRALPPPARRTLAAHQLPKHVSSFLSMLAAASAAQAACTVCVRTGRGVSERKIVQKSCMRALSAQIFLACGALAGSLRRTLKKGDFTRHWITLTADRASSTNGGAVSK